MPVSFLSKRSDFIQQMEGLIKLCAAKHIAVKPGSNACTDGKGTIFLPWLPEDATDNDFLKFFGYAMHEESHFHGKTDISKMAGQAHPPNKLKHFCENAVDDIRCERLQEIEYPGLKEYRRLFYQLILSEKLGTQLKSSDGSDKATFVHSILSYMILTLRYTQLEMSDPIETHPAVVTAYDRHLADLVHDINKAKSFSQALALGAKVYDRLKDIMKDIVEPPKEKESKDREEDKSKDDSRDGDNKDPGEIDEKETTTDGSREGDGEKDIVDPPKEKESKEGEEDKGKDKSRDGDNKDPGEIDEKETTSDGSRKDDGEEDPADKTDGSISSGEEPKKGQPDDDTGSDTESIDAAGKNTDSDADEDADEGSDKAIEVLVRRALEEVEAGDYKTIHDSVRKEIDTMAEGEYLVAPGVKDVIEYNQEGLLCEGQTKVQEGLKILGANSSRFMKLFVTSVTPTIVHNQRRGRFDMRSYLADPMDLRKDFYSDKVGAKIDRAAVSIMIDNSNSMSDTIARVYAIVAGLLHMLNKTTVPTEAVGFTADSSSGEVRNNPVQLYIVKKFDDRWDEHSIRRCVSPTRMYQNAEVDCLRYMVPRLWARPERKKILLILGDGDPCIGSTVLNDKLAAAYKRYLNACRGAGIVVFGFGIHCNLQKFFGEDYVSVDTDDMGMVILEKLRVAIMR